MSFYDESPSGRTFRVVPETKVLVDGAVKTVGSLPLVTPKVAASAWEYVEFGRGTETATVTETVNCRTVYSGDKVRALVGDAAYKEGMTLCLREGDRLKATVAFVPTAGYKFTGNNRGSSAARTGSYARPPEPKYLSEDDPPGTVGRVVNGELVGKSSRCLRDADGKLTPVTVVAGNPDADAGEVTAVDLALRTTSADASVTGSILGEDAQAWPGTLYTADDGPTPPDDLANALTWPPTQQVTEYWAPLVAVVDGAVVGGVDRQYVRAL